MHAGTLTGAAFVQNCGQNSYWTFFSKIACGPFQQNNAWALIFLTNLHNHLLHGNHTTSCRESFRCCSYSFIVEMFGGVNVW